MVACGWLYVAYTWRIRGFDSHTIDVCSRDRLIVDADTDVAESVDLCCRDRLCSGWLIMWLAHHVAGSSSLSWMFNHFITAVVIGYVVAVMSLTIVRIVESSSLLW